MPKTVDYDMTPSSPWTYLGHARFGEIARRHGAPTDVIGGELFWRQDRLEFVDRALARG